MLLLNFFLRQGLLNASFLQNASHIRGAVMCLQSRWTQLDALQGNEAHTPTPDERSLLTLKLAQVKSTQITGSNQHAYEPVAQTKVPGRRDSSASVVTRQRVGQTRYRGLISGTGSCLEGRVRKVLRPATSTQVFLGFPVSMSKC